MADDERSRRIDEQIVDLSKGEHTIRLQRATTNRFYVDSVDGSHETWLIFASMEKKKPATHAHVAGDVYVETENSRVIVRIRFVVWYNDEQREEYARWQSLNRVTTEDIERVLNRMNVAGIVRFRIEDSQEWIPIRE